MAMDEGKVKICNFPKATDVLADILVRLPLRLVCQLRRAFIDRYAGTDIRGRGKIETCNFPEATDVLADILARLPPNTRRQLRLVCKLWRDVIDKRTGTDMRGRGKILSVTAEGFAYVVDVLSPGHPASPLWSTEHTNPSECYSDMSIVGTCNGIVCMCDEGKPGGAITLANPSTGEALDLPPLPASASAIALLRGRCGGGWNWHQTYSFAYHPSTGRYKVVHVPSHLESWIWEPSTVHVFTLGEGSWRDVHVGPNARCVLGACHLADVDGTVYWVTGYTGRVVAFDLGDESVTLTEPLPGTEPIDCWLTKVHGRLGAVVGGGESVTVWVLEGTRWNRRFMVEVSPWHTEERLRWGLMMPHFAHGDYVLAHGEGGKFIEGHKMSEAARSQDGVVWIRRGDQVESLLCLHRQIHRTFAYVETKEPSSVYSGALVSNRGSTVSY